MGRRHTAGVVGYQAVGGVQVDNTTFTAAENLDIVMDPSGTGLFKIAGDAQLEAQGNLRFADADSSNYVAFQAPASVASNVTWTLPSSDGTASQALVTNASGTLSFATVVTALTDNTTDSATNYLTFTTGTSGNLTAARVSSTKLTFQPSTGILTSTGMQPTSLGVGTAPSGTTGEIRATNNITSFYSSDAKFKENVIDIPNALTTVLAIGGKLFDWTDDYITTHGGVDDYFLNKADFGVIAQDVQRVFPRAVRTREDGSLAVDYEKLSALAFAAIIELKNQIDGLKGV